jgi:preprotein translocase subunit SecD
MTQYPKWKYALVVIAAVVGLLYALPNMYGEAPAVQVSSIEGEPVSDDLLGRAQRLVEAGGVEVREVRRESPSVGLLVVADGTQQQAALDLLDGEFGDRFGVAPNQAPETPEWLRGLGASPMVLGLDLRGGVHFLLEVDMDTAEQKQVERFVNDIRRLLRNSDVSYLSVAETANRGVRVVLRDEADQSRARTLIEQELSELDISETEENGQFRLQAQISEETLQTMRTAALEQNITTLRNRVNELGVAEPVIQRQGDSRIVVQLPGVQDTVAAKEILGTTATLEYRLANDDVNAAQAARTGRVPAGHRVFYESNGQPIVLENRLIVSGDQLVNAYSQFDQQQGVPAVVVTLNGTGASRMREVTTANVGTRMAVVFQETRPVTEVIDGETVRRTEVTEEVISAAVIREPFGKRFQTTGIGTMSEASKLALLLRAGALAAPVEIIEERTVGPSLGKDNIERGFASVVAGFVAVLLFMAVYYRVFGLIANAALVLNLVLIVAGLSLLGATLTLPGIAGIVLTVGMAVDANVLIFDRIREELTYGNSPRAAIRSGYDNALSTIVDANITTLIAAVVLFGFGTGPIKGFAITLSIGILTSMFTALVVTRAMVQLVYGNRPKIAKLAI